MNLSCTRSPSIFQFIGALTIFLFVAGCSNETVKKDLLSYLDGLKKIQAKLRPEITELETHDERYFHQMNSQFEEFYAFSKEYLAHSQHLPKSSIDALTELNLTNKKLVDFYRRIRKEEKFKINPEDKKLELKLIDDHVERLNDLGRLIDSL